jgi:hypothetical protein
MNVDTELQSWQRSWRAQPLPIASAAELTRMVQRGTRTAVYTTLAAAVFTLLVLAPLLRRAAQGAVDLRFLTGILVFVALVWGAALWLARGTWRPRDESTAAFIEVSIRRARAAQLGVPVALVLYAAELLYVLMSMHRLEGIGWRELLLSPQFIAIGWIGGPLYLAGQLWYARRERRRLSRLREIQAELAAGS